MNFLQLEYFLTILKFNSISKAASELYITQPALSQQLIHLEKELATKLFYRKGNSLILTEAGERFRDSAQNMLYEYRTMQTIRIMGAFPEPDTYPSRSQKPSRLLH